MAFLVCGSRSALAWHMQVQAAKVGRELEVVDPQEFLATIPTDDDIDVYFDDNDDAEAVLAADEGNGFFSDSSADGSLDASEEESEAEPADIAEGVSEDATEAGEAQALDYFTTDHGADSFDEDHTGHPPTFRYDQLVYLADGRLWTPQDPSHTPTDEELAEEIRATTETVVKIMENLPVMPETVVLASSISAGNTTAVGQALAEAAVLMEQATNGYATRYLELQFPQVYGENFPSMKGALVAQLCAAIASGKRPRVSQDRPMTIMYAQEAARILTSDMPDFAMSMAESSKESTGEMAIILNEMSGMPQSGEIPSHIAPSRYGLLFQLYSTLRAAQLRQLPAGRHILPKLPTATVVQDLPAVTSKVHLVAPGETLELHGVLHGLHRVVVVSGTAELTLQGYPEVVLVAAVGDLPEEDQPSAVVAELSEDNPAPAPTGMPFFDMPHGYVLHVAATGGNPVTVAEWVSEP